jgi:glycosyltransferase involved in cell wall biosynthesis
MAHGVPTIATEVGGIPDLIQHGETGFLTRPGNVEEIAHYIKKLAGDERLRDRLATNCLRVIRRYSWNNVMWLYEDQLRRVVGDHRCPTVSP